MNRRQFLATTGGAGLLSLAGWRSTQSQSTLDDPTVETEEDGETHLHFDRDGERLATLTVQPARQERDPTPVDVSLWHADPTEVTSLSVHLRAPPAGHEVPAEVSLTAPQWSPRPSVELYVDGQTGGTVFEIPDTGGQGEGTMTFEFLVDPVEGSPSSLHVDATADLAEPGVLGDAYTIEGTTRVPLP